MKIILATTYFLEDMTSRGVLDHLASAYKAMGHEVLIVGWARSATAPLPAFSAPVLVLGDERHRSSRRETGSLRLGLLRQALPGAHLFHMHVLDGFPEVPAPKKEFLEAALKSRIPSLVSLHTLCEPSNGYWSASFTRLASRAATITAGSRFSAAWISERYPEMRNRIHVVPNGRGNASEKNVANSSPLLHQTLAQNSDFILCVSRLAGYKGIDILLMAWAGIVPRALGVKLLICGPDFSQGHYQRLAKHLGLAGSVVFADKEIPRNHLADLQHRCLFAISPARIETFGLALLEAMSAGKAVIATKPGGPEDFVEDGGNGFLVPSQDAAALGDAMLELLGNPDLRHQLGARAKKSAARFSWDNSAKAYLQLRSDAG